MRSRHTRGQHTHAAHRVADVTDALQRVGRRETVEEDIDVAAFEAAGGAPVGVRDALRAAVGCGSGIPGVCVRGIRWAHRASLRVARARQRQQRRQHRAARHQHAVPGGQRVQRAARELAPADVAKRLQRRHDGRRAVLSPRQPQRLQQQLQPLVAARHALHLVHEAAVMRRRKDVQQLRVRVVAASRVGRPRKRLAHRVFARAQRSIRRPEQQLQPHGRQLVHQRLQAQVISRLRAGQQQRKRELLAQG
jgi:hypothetical protein